MKTGMTGLGRRSPSRPLAFPAGPFWRLASRGGQPVALAAVRGAQPDIIELILRDHERIRTLLRRDDAAGYGEDPGCREPPTLAGGGAATAGAHACRAGAGNARIVRGSWPTSQATQLISVQLGVAKPEALIRIRAPMPSAIGVLMCPPLP
jgi:hypothetical protein